MRYKFAFILLTFFIASAVFSEDFSMYGPCAADMEKFCGDLPIGQGKRKQCLKEHTSQLSTECKQMQEASEAFMGSINAGLQSIDVPCKDDIDKYCGGMGTDRLRIVECLSQRRSQLSSTCQEKIPAPKPASEIKSPGYPWRQNSNGLLCEIEVPGKVFHANELIEVHMKLKNIGTTVLRLPDSRWDFQKFHSSYSCGYTSKVDGGVRHLDMPPFLVNGKVLSKLEPGETADIVIPLKIGKPQTGALVSVDIGIGNMRIANNEPVPPGYSGWTGWIQSNEIQVDILP